MRVFSWFVLPQFGAELGALALHRPIAESAPDEACFWAKHNGAELDLLLLVGGRRVGVEIKRVDAPRRTSSMTVALEDLRLGALYVVYPGDTAYGIDDRIAAVPAGVPLPKSAAGSSAPAAYPTLPGSGE